MRNLYNTLQLQWEFALWWKKYTKHFFENNNISKIGNRKSDKSIAMNVERFGEQRTIWKSTNDLITRKLQWIWKDLANNISFENSQIIGWQVNWAEYRKIWRTTPHLKNHKWLDDKVIAMYVERFGKQCTIWKFTDRLEICRDRRDMRTCEIFSSCAYFYRKQNLCRNMKFTRLLG